MRDSSRHNDKRLAPSLPFLHNDLRFMTNKEDPFYAWEFVKGDLYVAFYDNVEWRVGRYPTFREEASLVYNLEARVQRPSEKRSGDGFPFLDARILCLSLEDRLNPSYSYYFSGEDVYDSHVLTAIIGTDTGNIVPHPFYLEVARGLRFRTPTQHSFRTFSKACDCVNTAGDPDFSLILRYDDDNGTRFLQLNKENINSIAP